MNNGKYIEISLLTYVEEGVSHEEAENILLDVSSLIDQEFDSLTTGFVSVKTREEVDNAE